MALNKIYVNLVRSCIGKDSINYSSSYMLGLLEKAISSRFDEVDELNQQILDMKAKHTQDMFELQLKLSELIELNYKLTTRKNND